MINLNKTSFDIWVEYVKDDKRLDVTERILFLDTLNKLTEEEEMELGILLSLEKKFLSDTEVITDKNKSYLKSFHKCKDMLDEYGDERLSAIFIERIEDDLNEKEVCDKEDVIRIYHELMEEDMDVIGHDNLNRFYNELINDEISESEYCDDPYCTYCRPVDNGEYQDAVNDLTDQGFFDNGLSERELMIKLMVTINRLHDELEIYRPSGGQHFEDYDDEDDE